MKAEAGSKAGAAGAEARAGSRSVVLGTAGHIDHGKTALVLALTGTKTDRLPEEKSRGITIDLGFAALVLGGPAGERLELSLIDVPGHHAFVRNMLAGAGGIDCVLLVVAADEGPRAQTVEHLQICELLGIGRGLVVLTKQDAVSAERLEAARGEVERLVEGTFLAGAPVLAVSALRGEGIAELRAALARMASEVPARSEASVPRLPLDRVFSVRGFGTVVTGTLQAGRVRTEDALLLEPGERTVRVRGVQVHGEARAEAAAPNRVALNLASVEVGDVRRGDMLVAPETLRPVSTVDAEVTVLPGVAGLRHRGTVRVHAFAAEEMATVLLYDSGAGGGLGAASGAETALVRLRLHRPMVLAPGDRFVLRQPSPAMTVGGGRVLDGYPLPRLRKPATAAWLRSLRGVDVPGQVPLRLARRGMAGVSVRQMVAETGLTREAVRRALQPLVAGAAAVSDGAGGALGEHVLAAEALREAADAVFRELSRAAGSAKGGGLPRAELRSRLRAGRRLEDWVFGLALARLLAERRVEAQGEALRMPGTDAGAGESPQLRAVEALYRTAGLAAPIASEVTAKLGLGAKELHTLITTLLRTKRLVRMGGDNLLVHADALDGLVAQLRQRRGESFDVGRFKAMTGLTRKHAIPLLEYLDGARVTRNSGGTRTIL